MKKRVFVAIKVSNEIKKKIQGYQSKLNNNLLNFLSQDDLHITVLSPWDEEDIENAKSKLSGIKGQIKPFEISFNHITLGPYFDRPKLVWAKGKSSKELYVLKEILERVFDKYSERRFKLHLTLAKFDRENTKFVIEKWENENIVWTQMAESLVLFESILENNQVSYKILKEVQLT